MKRDDEVKEEGNPCGLMGRKTGIRQHFIL